MAFKRSQLWLPVVTLPALWLGAGVANSADEKTSLEAAQIPYETEIRPLVNEFCLSCHSGEKPKAGVDLSKYETVLSIQNDAATWRKVLSAMHERNMPPANKPQPSPAQRDRLTQWIKQTLDSIDQAQTPRNPGRVLIHRLSRTEYNNTVRDLFGIASRPADSFPADGSGGGGFDNNADTLFIPAILMEKYFEAAATVLDEAKPQRLFLVRPSSTIQAPMAARKIIAHFAMRAFRRPVESSEIERFGRVFDAASRRGQKFESAVKLSLKAILVSPQFLFRIERDQPSRNPYRVSDWELASRLSYFLWASMPDEELFRLAAAKQLRNPAVLEKQVRRMMQNPKFGAMTDSFAAQWLRVRELHTTVQPDPNRYKEWTPSLRDAMYDETTFFVRDILRRDASLLLLLDADYTFLNGELAHHYGIEGVQGAQMRRVSLHDGRRGGLLTMGSILTLSSYPQRTSPVLRGKWVLEEILGAPPPPPPPNAGGLSPDDAPQEGLTFRQRLEKHREKPECASCHNRMDPIGFGLENFDGIGRWRETIGGTPVDAAGVLSDGQKFSGPIELKKHLMTRREDFLRNLTERMLSYALGRGLEPFDAPTVRAITQKLNKNNAHSSTLLLEIVRSYPFQYRKNIDAQ